MNPQFPFGLELTWVVIALAGGLIVFLIGALLFLLRAVRRRSERPMKAIDQTTVPEPEQTEPAAPMAIGYRLGRLSDVGRVRSVNEDSLLTVEVNRVRQSIGRPFGVFVVADGLGGHAAGEVASAAVVDAIAKKALAELLEDPNSTAPPDWESWMKGAVEATNEIVFRRRQTAGTDMGSTLAMALLVGNQAYIAHVGDSRVYLINSGGIRRLTTDHSLVERLVTSQVISREDAASHPQRNVIYRTLGNKSQVDVDASTFALAVGDRLLLCSDGLSGPLDDDRIRRIVMEEASSPQDACNRLIAAANEAGGDDNITAVVVEIASS